MKISVAGTGFASFICIKYLVEMGIKPIVFDVGNKINEENKISIKSQSIARERNFDKYFCLGGLSNIWTGVIEKYSENDFLKWPINKNDLDPHYEEIFKFLNQAEIHSFYSQSVKNLLNYDIKKKNNLENNEIYNDKKLSMKFASLLTNRLQNGGEKELNFNNLIPFNLNSSIEQLIKDSKIELRKEKILKVAENSNNVLIDTVTQTNQKKQFECDYLFLGCGTISSYLIIKNSFKKFDNSCKIKSSKKIVFPVKFKNIENFKKRFFNTFPLIQINQLDERKFSIYSQIYNLNPNIINFVFPKLKNLEKYIFLIKFFKNYGFSYFSLGSNYSDEFEIDNNNNIKVYKKKYKAKEIVSYYHSLFDKNFLDGQIVHFNLPIKIKSLSGNHFGSSFPMTERKKNFFDSDILGRVGNFKKISITDSSIFSSLSSCPPTLTILANSLRITKEVFKKKFFIT